MTIPRDAIGLSDRLRDRFTVGAYVQPTHLHSPDYSKGRALLEEAATALDALQGEISQWANEVARYKAYAEKFYEENAALQARVKELERDCAEAYDAAPPLGTEG